MTARNPGLAFAPARALMYPCGSCTTCQDAAREEAEVARLRLNGMTVEVLGTRKECLRKSAYDRWVRDHPEPEA